MNVEPSTQEMPLGSQIKSSSESPNNGNATPWSELRDVDAERNEERAIGTFYCAGEVRILVIDDDVDIGKLIQAALEPKGFLVDSIADPLKVRDRLEGQQYHLVILDYVLPGIETEEVIQWIKQLQSAASIIVVTAYPSMHSAVSSLRAQAYDYVTKPFSVQSLREVVTRCLESRGLLRLSEEALRGSLGNVIRDRRKAQDMTLAKMSERTGISLGYLSQIELGRNSASIETLYKISLGLGTRLSDLFHELQNNL